ncbi:MAG: protein kinase [Polyangiaceae bacterium]
MNSGEWSRQRALSRIGELVKGKWRIESLVGIGGTAAVYAATHRNGLRAAIKILRPELAAYTEVVTRFVREGYAANRVGHPGVVQVLDDDVAEDGAPFLVMELLEGEPLENYARDPKNLLPLPRALDVINQVLDVLAAAHAQGILHRDIKPANIFMTYDGRVKVLDFGIARLMQSTQESHTLAGAAIGTPAFMPPEQARGRWNEVDGRTDLWAVGAMAHAMFVGGRPRRAQTAQEELLQAMTTPLPLLHSVAPQVPPQICAVFDTALDFERDARFADARAMQLALRNACIAAAMPPPTLPTAQFTFGTSDINAVVAAKGATGSTPALQGASPSNPSSHVTGATGQAVSMSHSPLPVATKPKRTAPLIAGIFMLAAVSGFGLWGAQRYRSAHARSAAEATAPHVAPSVSAAPMLPTAAPTSEPSVVLDSTPPVPSSAPSATGLATTAPSLPPPGPSTKKPSRQPNVPAPAKTFNPLDQRF